MAGRRIGYLAALAGCVVFYIFYQEWMAFFLLIVALVLPWASLLMSLPGMLTLRLQVQCPVFVTVEEPAEATLRISCPLPQPSYRTKLRVRHTLSGQNRRQKANTLLPTKHCSQVTVEPVRARVYDYMGIFWLPVRQKQSCALLVRPKPVAIEPLPSLDCRRESAYRPKFGGGYAEDHELRLYRPGDDLRGIHWKLTAKTGKLIFREPMEPLENLAAVTLALRGTPEELDKKLGELLWLSQYLIGRNMPHRICCLTGRGMETFHVDSAEDVFPAIDALLCAPAARQEAQLPRIRAAWQYEIGGGAGEP